VNPGDVIEGRYRIQQTIGSGGMGTVFLAEHVMIKRRVAIKVLHPELSTNPDIVKRFLNEARAAGTLGHPNIVESFDMGVTPQHVMYIVFEYLEGTLLSDEVYRCGGLPVRRALRIADQIASALSAAHTAGIVHRDLKSENIFLTDKEDALDHVKVIDFGISRFLEAGFERTGRGGALMGTLEFMAPEQVTTPESVDHRADVYALGIVLYEMLSASVPFRLETKPEPPRKTRGRTPDVDAAHALFHQIVTARPPPIARFDAPPGLAEMIEEKLLAKDPAKRFQSMKDVQGAIAAFAGIVKSRAGTSVPPINEPMQPISESKPVPAAIKQLANDQTVSRSLIDPEQLAEEVRQLGQRWSLDHAELKLVLWGPMTKSAPAIANAAALAEELDHHPRIVLESRKMTLTIKTPDADTVTMLDLVFAARLESWLRNNGW
jgi:serine/threonine protein kinase